MPDWMRAALDHFRAPTATSLADTARLLDPRTVQTPALDLIDAELARLRDTPDGRLIISIGPQEGKSTRTARDFVVDVLARDPDCRIGIASYAQALANRNGRTVRNAIAAHPQLGIRIAADHGSVHEWQLAGHRGGVLSVGRGAGVTGRALDCVRGDMHIDCEHGRLTAADAFTRGITRILAYDHTSRRAVWRNVEAARRINGRPTLEITTEAGRVLVCTPDHRVHTGRGYVPAGDLRPGDTLLAIMDAGRVPTGDTVRLVRERGDGPVAVYDFQVEGARNFFAEGVLVHNCLIIDDPIKDRAEADSETIRDTCWDWWTDSLSTRLSPGAPVVLIQTRWHSDDLAGRLMAAEDGHLWRVVNIPAQADHDPGKGETDLLGREPGEFLESARGRTRAQWEAIKTRVGSRTWNALYQGRPSPTAGTMFRRHWWQRYDQPLWLERDGTRYTTGDNDFLIISADLAFKDTAQSDYVAIQVWMRREGNAYLLDQTRDRLDFPATCAALRRLTARWPQALLKIVEEKANGAAVIASLKATVPGLVPEIPQGSKTARAAAVTPLVEAGNVWLPSDELAPWVGDFIEELAAFPHGKHDDQVDAGTQALNRLFLQPIDTIGKTVVADEYATLDERGWLYSPY